MHSSDAPSAPTMLEAVLPGTAGAWVCPSIGARGWDSGTGDRERARSCPTATGAPGTASPHPVGETQVCPCRPAAIPQLVPLPPGISLGKGQEDSTIMWRWVAWPGGCPSCHCATCAVSLTQLPRIVSPSGSSCPGTQGPSQPLL